VIYEQMVEQVAGKTHRSYQKTEILTTRSYAPGKVKVYDVHGKSVNTKDLPDLLRKETVALISFDPQAADPLNLRLFKEGTLLFILPGSPPPSTYYPASAAPGHGYPTPEAAQPPSAHEPPSRPAER
jgi:hypothetical protein